jgi:hypothetical protein
MKALNDRFGCVLDFDCPFNLTRNFAGVLGEAHGKVALVCNRRVDGDSA